MKKSIFENTTVIVTGASSGIGEAFARCLAKRGANLILTARSQDKLVRLANELKGTHGISAHVFPVDLSLPEGPTQLWGAIKDGQLTADFLINNAGFGKWSHFLGEDWNTYQKMLSLNISALVELTHSCLPDMLARGRGGIINVASTAAFQPVPYVAVYSASKSFVLSFSEALAGEYQEHGIHVLALCPGPTETDFNSVAHVNAPEEYFAAPSDVAEAGLKAFEGGRTYLVHGSKNYITSLLPRILSRAAVIDIVRRMFKDRVRPLSGVKYGAT